MENNKLIQMGVDLYFNRIPNYSKEDANKAFHQAMLEVTGGKTNVFELDPMQRHNMFNLIQVTIDTLIPQIISADYDRFCEVKNVQLGDKPIFQVTDPSFFKVGIVADGVNSVRSQRLDQGQLVVSTKNKTIKIAEDLTRFLSGRCDWATMINRVAMSFVNDIRKDIYTALKNTYAARPSAFKENGSFDAVKFNTLVQRVGVYSMGSNVNVFGTKLALGKVLSSTGFTAYPGYLSQNMLDELNQKGYVANFQGTDLVELQQSADVNSTTYDFAIDNSYLFVMPTAAEKIVKVVYEGASRIISATDATNADDTMSYTIRKKLGVGVISPAQWGIYTLS